MKIHIKKDDTVKVLSGKDRGKEGRVMVVYPATSKAIVEGVNMIRKHLKPNQENPNGGIIDQEAPIHISNLMLVENGTPTRTGRKRSENGKGWVRYSKNTGETI